MYSTPTTQIQQSDCNTYEQTRASFINLVGKSNPYDTIQQTVPVRNIVQGIAAALLSTNLFFLIVIIATFTTVVIVTMLNIISWGYKRGVNITRNTYEAKDTETILSKRYIKRQKLTTKRKINKQRANLTNIY